MFIDGKKITYSYNGHAGTGKVLKNVDFNVHKGEFVAVLGCNGCGKSTLVKHLNGLIKIQSGQLVVDGIDVHDQCSIWELCRKVGMVFQNPDNQFVSLSIEEDIAFGLKNYDFSEADIRKRVSKALENVDMAGFEDKNPHMLSGGQKQRIALAGVMALEPEIIVFDEATSMMDPEGRKEFLGFIEAMHDKSDTTIIMITHYIEESINADKVIIMDNGKITAEGKPAEILTNEELLTASDLKPPFAVNLYHDLKRRGICLPYCPLTIEECADLICRSK